MKKILQEIDDQSYLHIEPNSKYVDRLNSLSQLIKNKKQKTKLIMITVAGFIIIILAITIYNLYQDHIEESERQAQIEKRKSEEALIKTKEEALIEAKRKEENIKRVTNTIFINTQLDNLPATILASQENMIVDDSKGQFYIKTLQKTLAKEINTLSNNIKTICETEAGKEVETIESCIKNNTKEVLKRTSNIEKDLTQKIKTSILELKLQKRDKKLNKMIAELDAKLQKEKTTRKKYFLQMDEYVLNGKPVPDVLEKNIDSVSYTIKNYKHQLKHYKSILNDKQLSFSKPKDLKAKKNQKKPEKKIYRLKEIKKSTQVPKNITSEPVIPKTNSKDIKQEIADLQTQIDNIYIEGGTPDSKLTDKLKMLKKQL